jgi:hypothetical protein
MSSRNSLVAGGVVVLLVLGAVFFVLNEPKKAEAPDTHGDLVGSKPAEPGAQPPGFQAPGTGAEPLVPAGGEPKPVAPFTPKLPAGEGEPAPVVAVGKVTWAGGTLPDDVDVSLYDTEGTDLDVTTADKDGKFELRWGEVLGDGWSVGTDTVNVTLNGQVLALAPDTAGNLPLHVPGEPPVEVNLVLGFPPVISGRVFDRITGEPIEGAEITAVSTLPAWSMDECYALSEKDGSYSLPLEDVPLRQVVVWCRDDEWQAQMSGPQDLAPVKTAGENLHLDFALEKPLAWRGRITSAADGLPVPDATITVGNDVAAFSDFFDFEISDEDGQFELELPEVPVESAWVHVSATDFAPVALRGVKPGNDLTITLAPALTLSGTVSVRGSDTPVEGADVQIFFDGETIWGDNALYDEDFSGKDGTFEITLESAPLDAARVKVDATGYAPFEVKLASLAKAAGPGKQTMKVELQPVD